MNPENTLIVIEHHLKDVAQIRSFFRVIMQIETLFLTEPEKKKKSMLSSLQVAENPAPFSFPYSELGPDFSLYIKGKK